MKKRRKRKKIILTAKDRKKKMLKNSEWILLGILFVAISEVVVKSYGLTWRYLPYTFAICGVMASKIIFKIIHVLSRGAGYFLNSLKDL